MELQGRERVDATVDSVWGCEGPMSQEGCRAW